MHLSKGDRVGPYEILAPIGKGGMGEVKVLPTALAQDPERLTRFEREAKVLASLNHPNIATIYGVEESEGSPSWTLVRLWSHLASGLPRLGLKR